MFKLYYLSDLHIINGVVEIKNNIMRKKLKIRLPMNVYLFFAAVIIIFSVYLSSVSFVPEKVIYVSYLFSMPQGMVYKIGQFRDSFISKYFIGDNSGIIQNGGSINELIGHRDFSDLTVTPEDIIKSTEKLMKDFENKKYEYDGDIVERTFTDNQATDSYMNVHVRNVTADSEIDIESILNAGCTLPVDDCSEPVVLIYHTHSTESYMFSDNGKFSSDYPTRNDDRKVNMIRVGDEITAVLESKGIGVIHDRSIYDKTYTGAYDTSRAGIEKILEKYPTIVITLDIHRDAIYYDDYTRVKPTAIADGKKASQMMIITGAQGGNVTSFPDWETNLSFALNLQNALNTEYENLMKPVYFCNRKYNMDITPYSLLIEVGTDVNTLEESAYSGRLLGSVLADYIKNNMAVDENE